LHPQVAWRRKAAQTLDPAKKRVTALAKSWPGEYVITHKNQKKRKGKKEKKEKKA